MVANIGKENTKLTSGEKIEKCMMTDQRFNTKLTREKLKENEK